jgi:hypothetical protein
MLARRDHIDILKSGVRKWNTWREENATVVPQLSGADLRETNLAGVAFEKTDLCKAKLFFGAKLDTNILSEIQTNWPEKLATIWDDAKKDWDIDSALLEQVKKPDWQGW